jgi:hypothetical protein
MIRAVSDVSYGMEYESYERPGALGMTDIARIETHYHTFTPNASLAEDTFDLPAGATGAPN